MLRDSAMFSVIAAEWPAVKSALAVRVTNASTGSRRLVLAATGWDAPG
jgi:hypothetical protein